MQLISREFGSSVTPGAHVWPRVTATANSATAKETVPVNSEICGCAGARMLVAALLRGGAPDLIEINLRDNPIEEEGLAALVSVCLHLRRRLLLGVEQNTCRAALSPSIASLCLPRLL
jgi:hypothetical protein